MKKLLAIVLSVLMVVSVITTAVSAADDGRSDGWYSVGFEKGAGSSFFGSGEKETEEEALYAPDDTVRVSIVLSGTPTIEKYDSDDISANTAAVNYRSKLLTNQDKVASKISRLVLGGEELDVVWNLTLAANIISANVKYKTIEKIMKLSEVKDVVIETYHETDDSEYTYDTAEPEMFVAGGMTNTYDIWADGYTGAGTTVAIVDTGIDLSHISFDGGAYEYALSTIEDPVDIYTKEKIAAAFDQLNIKKNDPELTVDDVYYSAKIPFAYNYVDKDTDVTHLNDTEGEHGSHVAGISAANRYVPDGNGGYTEALPTVRTQGQAPDAQLFVMKVFGKNGGAYDSDYYAAIEDSIVLGLDATNLSLGTSYPGFTMEPEFQSVIDSIAQSNTVVTISAGNMYYWARSTNGGLQYAEDKSLTMSGSPGVNVNSLSVASVANSGIISPVIEFADKKLSYAEPASYGNDFFRTLTGEREFIMIDGYGDEEDFDALADVLPGKIFICSRGAVSFYVKANNAVENGAIATVIYNNTSGSLSMNLTGYAYTAPVISITQNDSNFIKENAQKVTDDEGNVLYYTGTLNIPDGIEVTLYDNDYYTMSDFSSWGVPGSLLMKPEITAPGGSIYSVYGENKNDEGIMEAVGNDKYELMSGTSMAAPQVAGISALVAEYIRKNDLETKTGLTKRQLTNALLMGTSRPLLEESSKNYYSILKQGSGLIDTKAAFSTHTYITMHEDATVSYADGKVKAELGEVSRSTKSFDFTFDVNNFGDQATDYLIDADFFTQDYVQGPDYNALGQIKTDGSGNEITRLYMDLTTTDLKADVVWTVNGETVTTEDAEEYDFNNDGKFSYSDIQIVLEYVVGNIDTFNMMENADIDRDGDIDTYDAYLAEDILKQAKITVSAGQSATVNVAVTLIDIDDYDIDGAYIEGFVFVSEAEDNGVVSSIPVLGYYGSWSDFTMFDHSSFIEYKYNVDGAAPYTSNSLGENAYKTNYFSVNYKDEGSYIYYGNMYVTDGQYMPQRNAISPENMLNNVKYTLIRNAAEIQLVITDSEGEQLLTKSYGKRISTFYSSSEKKWYSTSVTNSIGFDPSTLDEGDTFTVTLRAAPEYYAMNGEIDWDSLSEKSSFSQSFTVDGTAPEILSVEFHYNEELQAYDAVRISVRDNQYTSCVLVADENRRAISVVGSDNDPDAAPGIIREVVIDLTEAYDDLSELPDHIVVGAADYANNESEYLVNLNEEEIAAGRKVSVDKEEVGLMIGSIEQITAVTAPWGNSCEVIWSSDNEEVATVDENGLIKGVGIGETTVKATAADDPNGYATVSVSVTKEINNTYSGIVWDERSDKWFISFDLDDIKNYRTDHNEKIPNGIYSLCYNTDGTLYGSTFNENEFTSDVYIIDEETYEATLIGSSQYGYSDLAAAPAYSSFMGWRYMVGTYRNWLMWFDTENAGAVDCLAFNEYIGETDFVAIAFVSSTIDIDNEEYVDRYFAVDENGELYLIEITVAYFEEEDEYYSDILSFTDLGNIGGAVDTLAFQSLYYDTNGYLIWSRTNTTEDYVYIYLYDVTDLNNIKKYDFGTLAVNVWPLGGIHEKGQSVAFAYDDLIIVSDESEAGPDSIRTDVAAAIIDSEIEACEPDASASSVAVTEETERGASKGGSRGISLKSISFDITADDMMKNGLYTVTFDADVYGLKSIESDAEYYAYNLNGGVLTLAFVEPDGYNEYDAVATIELYTLADGVKTVTVLTREANNAKPETADYLFVSEIPVYGTPEWTWADDYSGASVNLVRSDGFEITLDAAVSAVTTEPTCTAAGITVYTATASYEGKTYTDSKTVTTDALGHSYEGVVTAPTASSQGYTTYTCTRCGDSYTDDYVPALSPAITAQPQSWRGDWNEYPSITVTATGEGALRYQWYYRNAGETKWHLSSDKDNCYDSYPLDTVRNGREVYCVITDANGNTTASDIATMSVYIPDGYTGPVITAQPEDWAGDYGDYPSISVTADGIRLTYKWYYRNAGSELWVASSDRDSCYDSYQLNGTRDGREVYCVITDKYGFTVSSTTAVMKRYIPDGYTGPVITAQPADWSGDWNEYPDITVAATGEELRYQWYYKNADETKWHVSTEKDDCYDSYPLVAFRNGREVYCVITDKYGFSVTSKTARMELYIPDGYTGPTIITQPTDAAFANGEKISVSVKASGDGLTYKWYYQDAGATKWKVSSECDDCYDGYAMSSARNGRKLYCVITDKYGFSIATAAVTVTMVK